MKGLRTTVKGLLEVPTTKKPSYAEVLRTGVQLNPQGERERTVPARRARKVVIAPGNEDLPQKKRTGPELVRKDKIGRHNEKLLRRNVG